jgi:hypothetical protein
MSETETDDGGSKAAPKKASGRRSRPPVTIDLAAESTPAAPAAPDTAVEPVAAAAAEAAPTAAAAAAAAAPAADAGPAGPEPSPAAPSRPAAAAAVPPISPFPPRVKRPKTDWSSAGRLIAAGVFGGALATVLGILYHASGIIPTRADLTAAEAVRQAEEVAAKVATFEARLAAVETAAATLPALAEKVAALEKLEDTNRSRIENLENAMPVAGGGDGGVVVLGPLEARIEAAETRLASLGEKVDNVSTRLDELAARPPPAVESERAARAIAIGLLRQGADSGTGFAADLAMLKALGMDGEDVAALEPLAKRGAPTIATLQAAFPSVADAILAAADAADPDAGFFDRVAAFGRGLVSVRPTAPIEGDTPEAIVSRMQDAVNRADLATALEERETLPPEAQSASASWATAASDRAAIDAIIERLALSVTPPAN